MSIEAIAWVYSVEATPQERNVLFTLALFADNDWYSWPGLETIQGVSNMSRSAVIRAINALERRGYLERIKRGHRGMSTTYRLLLCEKGVEFAQRVTKMTHNTSLIKDYVLCSEFDTLSSIKSNVSDTLSEAPDDDFVITPQMELSAEFVRLTHIPERPSGRWIESLNLLVKMGVTPRILQAALDELGDKYNLSGPWSVINACANVMRRKTKKEKQETFSEEW